MNFDYTKQPGRELLKRSINTEGEPLLSIVTPFYNAGKYFEQTYNCVMNQTFPWFEWIIVNDGSNIDKDIEILKKYAKTDKRIKLYHKENGGQSSARNVAINKSSTDIVVPLDADDLIDPTMIECLYWGLYFNRDASWCYTNSVGFGEKEYLWNKMFSSEVMKTENILTCNAAIRKKDLLNIGSYDEVEKHYDEDWRLWLKLLSEGYFPVHLNYYGFWYRKTNEGMAMKVKSSSELKKKSKRLIEEVAAKINKNIAAKEYPYSGQLNKFIKPKKSEWAKNIFKEHNKINILMLLPWMEMGGADLFNLDIVKNIDKNRYEMSILTTVSCENTWRQLFEEYVTDVFDLTSFLDIENYAEFISYFIKSRQIDIIFLSNSYYGYYLLPWIRKEFPDVSIVDYVHMEEWYWRNGGYARTSGIMGQVIEKTYVCNERTRNVLIKDFGRLPETVETIYIGVDKDRYDKTKVEKGHAKKEFHIEESRPVILFPCRIHPQKRPFLMLEIAKELKDRVKDIAIIVVGDGPQLEELKQKSKDYKLETTVYFAGRKDDMRPYYRDSNITLICSIKEGLALTAYESLSMGVPVVSSDVGGQRELIDDEVGKILSLMQNESDDLNSRSFDNREIMQYINTIENLLQDKENYDKLCNNCRKRIEDKFSSDIMISKLQYEFEKLMSFRYKICRNEKSEMLLRFNNIIDDYITLYNEFENKESEYTEAYTGNIKSELLRIAGSRKGAFIIKVAFKLKLNKLF